MDIYLYEQKALATATLLRELRRRRKIICGRIGMDWVILFDTINTKLTLFNSFYGQGMELPQLNQFTVDKAVVSTFPNRPGSSSPIVFVIYGEERELAYYVGWKGEWTFLKEAGSYYNDIVSHEGQLYAVDEYGKLVTLREDPYSYNPIVQEVTTRFFFWGKKVYLLNLDSRLVMVVRDWIVEPIAGTRETNSLRVAYLDESQSGWVWVGNVGGYAILLGNKDSVALWPSSDRGLEGNRIYFKDSNSRHALIQVYEMRFDITDQFDLCYPNKKMDRAWDQHIIT